MGHDLGFGDKNEKSSPRLIFNASTNVKGGAVQNAANFLVRAQRDESVSWSFVVSREVADAAGSLGAKEQGVEVVESPARSRRARAYLTQRFNSDSGGLVYTMAGPAYVNVRGLHVMGISNPYLTHPTWEAYWCGRSPLEVALDWGKNVYRRRWARKAAVFVFQTETAKRGFCAGGSVAGDDAFVVPNAFGLGDVRGALRAEVARELEGRRMVFVPAAGYPHKALNFIPEVVAALGGRGVEDCVFVLTLDFGSGIWRQVQEKGRRLGVMGSILNLGVTPYKEMAALYRSSEVVFVPSLLETFSTSYLEAMGFQKPLVVPDRAFAVEVCGRGALYYDGTAGDAGRVLRDVLAEPGGAKEALRQQKEVLAGYGGQDTRYNRIMEVLGFVLSRYKSGGAEGIE